MPVDKDIKKGFFYGVARLFSFIISATISGFFGLSIIEETIPTTLFAIFGGFIGGLIFTFWWNSMKSPSNSPTFKALIFTILTLLLLAGIVFLVLDGF